MSVFQSPNNKGKWHCNKCNTWCMDSVKECSLCGNKKPVLDSKFTQAIKQEPVVVKEEKVKDRKSFHELRVIASDIINELGEAGEKDNLQVLKLLIDMQLKKLN